MRRPPRWLFLFIPGWLAGFLIIGLVAMYFAFRAPAVTAMVTCWILLGGGIWAVSNGTPR
jgi:hypothetical protein